MDKLSHSFYTHTFSLLHGAQTILRISSSSPPPLPPPPHRIIMTHQNHNNSLTNETAFGKFTRIAVEITEAVFRAQVDLPIAYASYRK